MAHKFDIANFLVIEAKAKDFLSIGFGAGGEMSEGTIEGGVFDGFIMLSFEGGKYMVCDGCIREIGDDEPCYYVAVLNYVLCKECFTEWSATAKYYSSDAPYELRHYEQTKSDLMSKGLWED